MKQSLKALALCTLLVSTLIPVFRGIAADNPPGNLPAEPPGASVQPEPTLQTYDVRDIETLMLGSELVTVVNGERSSPMLLGQSDTRGANGIASIWTSDGNINSGRFQQQLFQNGTVTPNGKTRDDIIREVVAMITSTVSPDSWRDAGGTLGSLREMNGTLYITQSPPNQKLIKDLLDLLRKQLGPQITLDIQAIAVDLPTYEALTKDEAGFLSTTRLDELLEKPKKAGNITVLAKPRIMLMSGQTAGISHGQSKGYIEGWAWVDVSSEPSAVKNATTQKEDMSYLTAGNSTILPTASMVTTGWSINVKVAATADRQGVVVQMEPSIALLRQSKQIELPETLKKKGLYPYAIEAPDIERVSFASTLTIPNEQYAVVGGQKLRPDERAPADERFMVFLVRPTIMERRDPKRNALP